MNVIRKKDGSAIINCDEMEAPIVLTALKSIIPKYEEEKEK